MQLRLDRLITLYLVSPLLGKRSDPFHFIPILMYHSIANEPESAAHPYYQTTTDPGTFSAQLRHLSQEGYTSCSLEYAINYLQTPSSAFAKRVVITYDDGYSDFYQHAFPILQQYAFQATVFLPTAYIGERPISFKGRNCLTWGQVKELSGNGIHFGSHTVNHPQLHELSCRAINEELVDSKRTIEDKLGRRVDSFSYPYAFPQTDGNFKKMLRESLQMAGYQAGVCTVVGRANRHSDPLFLTRLPVNSCDDIALFDAKLNGAYDWISKSQYASKMIRSRLKFSTQNTKCCLANDFPGVQPPS